MFEIAVTLALSGDPGAPQHGLLEIAAHSIFVEETVPLFAGIVQPQYGGGFVDIAKPAPPMEFDPILGSGILGPATGELVIIWVPGPGGLALGAVLAGCSGLCGRSRARR